MHVQWNTYGTWLPGDLRGFRNRDHRFHSSGTYHAPPPPTEHAALRTHAESLVKRPPVQLAPDLRWRVLESIVDKARPLDMPIAVLAVAPVHVHARVYVHDEHVDAEVGKLKRYSSHSIRDSIPETVRSAGCHPLHVENDEYWWRVVRYILNHRRDGAAV